MMTMQIRDRILDTLSAARGNAITEGERVEGDALILRLGFGGAVRDGARALESANAAKGGYVAALTAAGFHAVIVGPHHDSSGWWIDLRIAERRIGDDGVIRCGDLMGDDGRRLCGGCCRPIDVVDDEGRTWGSRMANPDGCHDLLDRIDVDLDESDIIDPPTGWEQRAVERARREGVL